MKKTGKLLKEGIKAIEVRQKHIKIANRAELGWVVVAAYEEYELASNSYDEKQLKEKPSKWPKGNGYGRVQCS